MLKKMLLSDERTLQTSNKIGSKVYFLTICLLMIAMFYRKNVLGQSLQKDYWDIAAIFLITGLINVAANLYYGGILPVKFKRVALRIYLTLLVLGFIVGVVTGHVTSFVNGLELFIEVTIGSGVIIGIYYLFIYLGKRKTKLDE